MYLIIKTFVAIAWITCTFSYSQPQANRSVHQYSIPAVLLTDQNNETVDMSSFTKSKCPVLLNFFYTR
jgi:cytochrome oxidase Cu insertion factor (SCO1/SenC/PrrC family)